MKIIRYIVYVYGVEIELCALMWRKSANAIPTNQKIQQTKF